MTSSYVLGYLFGGLFVFVVEFAFQTSVMNPCAGGILIAVQALFDEAVV